MSLESILEHILGDARAEAEKIIGKAREEAGRIIQGAKEESERLYRENSALEKADSESQKQRLIVNARLAYNKSLLAAKQELIDGVFKKLRTAIKADKVKKQRVCLDKIREVPEDIDFYLDMLKQDYETEIAGILFPPGK